jgi:hypothetical protein
MAALVKVTDSLTGEPVIVNIDQAQSIVRQDDKTVISFDRDRVCCEETPRMIYNAVMAQR